MLDAVRDICVKVVLLSVPSHGCGTVCTELYGEAVVNV